MKTFYYAQSFSNQKTGKKTALKPDQPMTCSNEQEAINKAERMAASKVAAIAVRQEFDENSEEFGRSEILAQFGELPAGMMGDD